MQNKTHILWRIEKQMFLWTVSNSDVLLDPPSFHFSTVQKKIKVVHLYNQPGAFLLLGILGREFILVSSPLNICKEKCKCSVSRLTNYTSLLLRRLEVTQNSNDSNQFDCKDEIHVPEDHAVVNSKMSCKIWGINNFRRITVLLIHR